jgi:tripartite-type tricarboxylate transporter receptor subunit TctC
MRSNDRSTRRDLLVSGLGLMGTSLATMLVKPVLAQDGWPSRPIKFISAGSPGSTSDLFVRILEPRLRERLGQNVFIENKPGAGGMVAAGVAASAPPDGYTFFVSNVATNSIGVTLYKKPSFDPKRDLPAVARIATLSNALAVRSDRGWNSLTELLSFLKANPKAANFGSAGSGTTSHLSGVMFAQKTGVAATHIPYKGTAANLSALLGGEISFAIDNLPVYAPHVKAGTLKLLAVTSAKRLASHPDIPTLQELGLPEFEVSSWFGVSAATGTPATIVNKLGSEIVAALVDPQVISKLRDLGAEAAPLGPTDYANFIESEIRKWAPVIKASGASVD